MWNDLIFQHWLTLHSLVVLLGLIVYAVDSHTRKKYRHPSAAIAWVISLALLPYLALPAYFVFGSRKLGTTDADGVKPMLRHSVARHQEDLSGGQTIAQALGLEEAADFDELSIHEDGTQALRALKTCIHGAVKTLDICVFLVGRDNLGLEISRWLILRAQQGVKVRLLVDGVGYFMGGFPSCKSLTAAGVEVAFFASPLRLSISGRTNLRNHRKMAIADAQHLWSGGRNLAAEYFEGDAGSEHKKKPWTDLSFDLRGPLALQAQRRFDADWLFATEQSFLAPEFNKPTDSASTGTGARLVPSGPDQLDDTIYSLIVSGCFTSQTSIVAVTPYFVPDQTLLMALTLAARRGVQVELLVPDASNHPLADIARRAPLRELSAAGARIWLFPGMIHAKAIIFDEAMALVGSANLDERSLFLNYELMVAFYDSKAVQGFASWIARQRDLASPYAPQKPGLIRELVEGLIRWIAFQL